MKGKKYIVVPIVMLVTTIYAMVNKQQFSNLYIICLVLINICMSVIIVADENLISKYEDTFKVQDLIIKYIKEELHKVAERKK